MLNVIWFCLIGILFIGYAILDGFDLGTGAWHLFVKKDEERRLLLNAIGPVWDGNEVWLIAGGGALFAAFPEAYATVFSGFYPAFMVLLAALIFRAVSIEFRSRQPGRWWRQLWDVGFSLSSVIAAVLLGVALGNLTRGIPLGPDHEFAGAFWGLLNPYALLIGLTTLALFSMHGGIYLLVKTEGDVHDRLWGWIMWSVLFFVACYVVATGATLAVNPRMMFPMRENPVLLGVVLLPLIAIVNIVRELRLRQAGRAFASSSIAVASLLMLFGSSVFPNLVISNPQSENSLTIVNAASSQRTLSFMLVIAGIGLPMVLAYTAIVHWVFRGKVRLGPASY
ncbi:MAG: cytochrome d ubiquinol oxidase subunit II [Elusimicrobiota bacterium]|jgi:cytochrome d ubiquinol oxidase subunit II